jgi:hypothetical protein
MPRLEEGEEDAFTFLIELRRLVMGAEGEAAGCISNQFIILRSASGFAKLASEVGKDLRDFCFAGVCPSDFFWYFPGQDEQVSGILLKNMSKLGYQMI